MEPAHSWPHRIEVGVVGPHAQPGPADFEVRAFFTDQRGTILEDPVTGSLNASIAQWFYDAGVVDGPYSARQGTALGRDGRVLAHRGSDGRIWIGGAARTHASGNFTL